MLKKLLLGLSLSALFLPSCKKEITQQGPSDASGKQHVRTLTYNFNNYPALVNGMLVFTDDAHYDSYIGFLDSAVAVIDPNDSIEDEHSVLQGIEDIIGFTSLRKITHTAFMNQNDIGFPSLQSIPDEHFIQSADLRSVLNNDREVKIGNDLIHYINKDFAVRVDAGQANLISQFRNLGSNATLDNVLAIDKFRKYSSVFQLTGEGGIWKRITPIPLGEYNIYYSGTSYVDPCLSPNLVKFRGLLVSWNVEPGLEAYFVVNYGDGSAPQTIYTVPALGGNETPSFTHLFPASGTYNVTIQAYSMSSTLLKTRVETVLAVGACTKNEKNSAWRYLTISGSPNRAVSGRIYLEFYGSSDHKMRMIAQTRSMQQKSDGSWKLVKGKIEVEAKCWVKNSACDDIEILQVYELKSNSKDMLKHSSKGSRFFWNTAESKHYLTISGTRYMLPISINSCP